MFSLYLWIIVSIWIGVRNHSKTYHTKDLGCLCCGVCRSCLKDTQWKTTSEPELRLDRSGEFKWSIHLTCQAQKTSTDVVSGQSLRIGSCTTKNGEQRRSWLTWPDELYPMQKSNLHWFISDSYSKFMFQFIYQFKAICGHFTQMSRRMYPLDLDGFPPCHSIVPDQDKAAWIDHTNQPGHPEVFGDFLDLSPLIFVGWIQKSKSFWDHSRSYSVWGFHFSSSWTPANV